VTIRVGIVGAGNIFTRGYLPALQGSQAVRVAAICDLDTTRARTGSQALGGVPVVPTHADLVARADVDAVLVLTPTHTHADIAIAAMQAGKHVLSEKPMARSAADARRMAQVERHTGRRLMVGHTRRFDERWLALAEQLRSGRIGDPVYLFRSEHAYNGAPADAWPWRNDESGGVLWDVGIHVADLFHWYLGERPRTAFTRLLYARPESAAGGAPDAAVVTYDFGEMRHALLSVSWIHPPAWGPFYATMEIVGTGGRLDYRDLDAHPAVVAHDAELALPRYSPLLSATATAFQREIEHFARAIETDAGFAITTEDAIVAVDMIDAAERSAASGRPEAVAP
jgi:UDP-N-acetylglucosamine 3-dehydrogenase